ncbi:MAG: hypothetical protein R6U98_21805 [Pirellulaceae bacterium]
MNSSRGDPFELIDLYRTGADGPETIGSMSRPGRTVTARTEQPAWSRLFEFSTVAVVDDSNTDAAHRTLLGFPT